MKAAIEQLPDSIYRAKGFLYLEDLPRYRIAFQMVGRRYNLHDMQAWRADAPGSEIVVIGTDGGTDAEVLQQVFDSCVGAGDERASATLRISRRLGEVA